MQYQQQCRVVANRILERPSCAPSVVPHYRDPFRKLPLGLADSCIADIDCNVHDDDDDKKENERLVYD